MLEPLPSRSVTRFLLPLADVMTLLFAIFLLLPHLEQQPGVQAGEVASPGSLWTAGEQRQVREELSRLRRVTELPVSQRLHFVVLNIDGKTGDLTLQEAGKELAFSNQEAIDPVIQRHQESARAGGRELFYVLQLPRDWKFPGVSAVFRPNDDDKKRYAQWFGKWKVNYEVSGLPRPRG